jgi:hypothetical protein
MAIADFGRDPARRRKTSEGKHRQHRAGEKSALGPDALP